MANDIEMHIEKTDDVATLEKTHQWLRDYLLFCIVFLFTKLSDLTINTRIMVLLSTIAAVVMAFGAFIVSVFVTV